MSWQAYVDTSLVGSGQADKAAIFNIQGTSVWATTPGFSVTPAELQVVVKSYNNTSNDNGIWGTGFHVAGDKFVTIKADDRSLYGKKGREGIVIVKTKQALLFAHYPESVQPGNAAQAVEKLADYLISVGY